MPSWIEIVLTLVAMVGLGLLVAEKGERAWAVTIAIATWGLVEFAFIALGFINAWYGLVD